MKHIFLLILATMVTSFQIPAQATNIAIVVYDKMNILDFAGPREVFSQANRAMKKDKMNPKEPSKLNVYTVGIPNHKVTAAEGTVLFADYILGETLPNPDIIVIPGGVSMAMHKDPLLLSWIKKNSKADQILMSVCTGSFILAASGILDGKEATTHSYFIDSFQTMFPKVKVKKGQRFTDERNTITTAGVSAGIDGALHLIVRLYGKEVAQKAVQGMEYDWNPKLQR